MRAYCVLQQHMRDMTSQRLLQVHAMLEFIVGYYFDCLALRLELVEIMN